MDKIAKAFVAAQTAFGPALKTSANPFFKSKYADLSVVIEAVIDALHNNGIALIQNCHESDNGVIVETIFLHESGQMISCGKLSVPAAKNDPQGYGSALTYARRYSLMAACGVAPEDDDGNAATKAKNEEKKPESAKSIAQSDFDNLHPARQQAISDLAMYIIAEFKPGNEEKAYDLYCETRDSLPLIEEKAALKSRLASHIRTRFEKINEARKESK